ncbi:MAG: glycosyltransferase family 1 protein [Bryobacteraceae bacterium]|jgi:glycosyltransferase involved in cell wall biosynthesis
MRVALDATPLALASGGLRRYTWELSRALAEQFPEDSFLLVSDQPFAVPAPAPPNLARGGGPRNALERRWWSWGLNRELARSRVDLFHGTNFEAPYVPARPSVITLHDLSPWMDPAWHQGARRVRRRTPLLLGLKLAPIVITPSAAVRRQAIERFRIHPLRILAVPEAAAAHFRPQETRPARPYFLFAGTLEPRKNLGLLVEAWRAARGTSQVELVLAGRRREDFGALPAEAGLRVLGEVPDAELAALYSGALAFLYPSLYEGFGLPVLEAMQCGAAVIASSDEAIAEVASGAAVLLGAGDARAWREAMRQAIERPDWVADLRARSLARAREYSWRRTARLTREVYEEARRQFGI